MSREFVTSGAGDVERIQVESPVPGVEPPAWPGAGGARPSAAVPVVAFDHDHDIGRLDAAAGCEFVDDRIRQRE